MKRIETTQAPCENTRVHQEEDACKDTEVKQRSLQLGVTQRSAGSLFFFFFNEQSFKLVSAEERPN